MVNVLNALESAKADLLLPSEDLYIFRAFMPGGWLSKHLEGYQMREGQLRLAQKIDNVLKTNHDLVAEGPTGIGKSLAYAVPLAYHTVKRAQKAVIVTANIALQEQLVTKDLPLLQKALPWKFKFALFKGRNNYLCKDALEELTKTDGSVHAIRTGQKHRLTMLDEQDKTTQHSLIAEWAARTQTGDMTELPFEPVRKIWDRFSVTSEDCAKTACPFNQSCFANQTYKALETADIIVTNYHIFFAQLAMGGLSGYEFVVFDEAHKTVDIAREFFGFRISEVTFKWLTSRLHEAPELRRNLEASSHLFFEELASLYNSGHYRERMKDVRNFHTTALMGQLGQLELRFNAAEKKTRTIFENAQKDKTCSNEDLQKLKRMAFDAGRSLATTQKVMKGLDLLSKLDPNYAYALEVERDRLVINAKKIDIKEDLTNSLFGDESGGVRPQSVCMLSATMAVGGSFEHIMQELGVSQPFTELFVAESPFDWVRQAKLIVPEELPDPKEKEAFRRDVGFVMSYIIEKARGRTLCLFTSWAGLDVAYDIIISLSKYRVLKQGDMPRSKLIEEFKKDESSVLLGVESFWQGIDVPGNSLVCVVMDKLPFPSLDDSVLDALQDRWDSQGGDGALHFGPGGATAENPFQTYSIPRMILSVKQGFGRLIRSVSDRGVVVILDRRIHSQWEKYGKMLVNSLPPVALSTDLDDVERFFK